MAIPLWIVPSLAIITILAAFGISFYSAVADGHVDPFLPYISDLGAFPPESCIFGQLLNIGAVLMALCFLIRHLQVKVILCGVLNGQDERRRRRLRNASRVLLSLGFVAAFGLSIVANFQETKMATTHLFGAILCFTLGNLYCHGQSFLTFAMAPTFVPTLVAWLRVLLSSVGTVAYAVQLGTAYLSSGEGSRFVGGYIHWPKDQPGYEKYIASAFAEWILGFSFIFYILSFTLELRHSALEWEGLEMVGRLRDRIDDHQARFYRRLEGETYSFNHNDVRRADTLMGNARSYQTYVDPDVY